MKKQRPIEIKKATRKEVARYIYESKSIIAAKALHSGVVGIYRQKYPDVRYVVCIPGCQKVLFDNPMQAVAFYNHSIKKRFGQHAILCDPLAAVRKWVLE